MTLNDNDIDAALKRLALTPDGTALWAYLHRFLLSVPATTDSGALQANHGARTFAAKLKALMDEGLAESTGGASTDRSVIVVARQPAGYANGPRGAQRRVVGYPDDPRSGSD